MENNEVRESQSFDLIDVAKNIAKEKGISSEEVITAMEVAIAFVLVLAFAVNIDAVVVAGG